MHILNFRSSPYKVLMKNKVPQKKYNVLDMYMFILYIIYVLVL